jgi:amidophosphoribosyltransferase
VKGKRVALIDDSIVRGTTSARIVKLVRDAGATEVHVRISSPPFTDPCYYGTDIDSRENLIANNHSLEEITRIIGADSLGYLSPESVTELTGCNQGMGFCTACFGGVYPTEIPSQTRKNRFEKKIMESDKSEKSIHYGKSEQTVEQKKGNLL